MNRTPEQFDFVVIGAGTGGLSAAEMAVRLGLKTALIEKSKIGGDCTWTGCIPSKALIKAARVAHTVRTAADFGTNVEQHVTDMRMVKEYVHAKIADVYAAETPEVLGKKGIKVIFGPARFINENTLQVADRTIEAKYVVLATGAHPKIPPIEGLDSVPYHTYDTFFDNETLPAKLIIVGAGPVGIEMAQAYARLGANVSLIDDALFKNHEPEVAQVMQPVFEREGMTFVNGRAESVISRGEQIVLSTMTGHEVQGDLLLVAVGRSPNIDGLGLEATGVGFSDLGIAVDKYLRTSNKRVFAVGDCIGGPQYTHLAGWQGAQVVRNAISSVSRVELLNPVIPSTIFTDPEVARVGLTEQTAQDTFGGDVKSIIFKNTRIDRAQTENDLDGFTKLVYRNDGTLVGATIVGSRAGEAITELAIAVDRAITVAELASSIHVYPTFSIGVQQAAAQAVYNGLFDGLSGKLLKLYLRAVTSN